MLKLAVVGGGVMGANHARVAHRLPSVDLVAVVDQDASRADALQGATGARAFASVDDLLAARAAGAIVVDAAVIAVPTRFHLPVARSILSAGLHALVEKPLAGTVEEAEELAMIAERAGVVTMVGHVERFNAVVAETIRLSDAAVEIEADRVGPFTARVTDSVILDLMIHDLDIVRAIARSEVTRVQAVAHRRHGPTEDLAVVLLEFASGATATLKASRLGQNKVRRLEVTLPDAVISADLIRQDISISRMQHVEFLSDSGTRYRQTGVVEIPFIENRGEPLAVELDEFASAIAAGRAPLVPVADGLEAVRLAHLVLTAAQR